MSAKAFFDTNVLLYIASTEQDKVAVARSLLAGGGCISVQVLNEFVSVARRKLHLAWPEIWPLLTVIVASCEAPAPITMKTHWRALALSERYGYTVYDSLLLASALEQGCNTFFSEDLHDGQTVDGLTIRNPFRRPQ